jgi:multicomponent Na+:H+ antiporter subunit G
MTVLETISAVLLVAGAAMSMLAGIAVLRFPDTRSRVHAATKPQVLGIMLLMLGVGLRLGTWAVVGQLVLIVIVQFLTAPVSAHLVVREAQRAADDAESDHEETAGAVDDDPAAPSPQG